MRIKDEKKAYLSPRTACVLVDGSNIMLNVSSNVNLSVDDTGGSFIPV
ncbi:MAG: hypothetical protein IIU55_04270 [Paludibacteraceae bacterium]|jgi:ferric-dicitrate binding protein FerR (iron transport regulator)|nr:hypothetical protein [Paludibacteraceae bacterium]